MKQGLTTFNITENICACYLKTYKHMNPLILINGMMKDSHYQPLRAFQKTVIKQIVEKAGFTFNSKNLTFNMNAIYDSREIGIEWGDWKPFIVIDMHQSDDESRFMINLENEEVSETMEVLIY